jgi:arabinofuranosyltransferase
VAASPNIGVLGYAAGPDVYVADQKGLADAVGARLRIVTRGRPGHEKSLPLAWVLARFVDPATLPPGDGLLEEMRAARSALGCGELRSLMYSVSAPLTPHRFGVNILRSFRFTSFRVDPNAIEAKLDLCR